MEKVKEDIKSLTKNKKSYDAGLLWGTWSDKKDKSFYDGKPLVIKSDGTWTIKGVVKSGKVEWDDESIINLKRDEAGSNSNFVTFISDTEIEVMRDKDKKKFTLVKGPVDEEKDEKKETKSGAKAEDKAKKETAKAKEAAEEENENDTEENCQILNDTLLGLFKKW